MSPEFSVIHPSRSRPKQALATINRWLEASDRLNDIEYLLSVDLNDPCLPQYQKIARQTKVKLLTNNNTSAIAAVNYAAHFSTGRILIQIAEDFDCPTFWDTFLLKELDGKDDFLLKTQDGIQKTLVTLPILDRTYYNRFGYIYEKGYIHMFCDQELTAVAHLTGKILTSNLFFEHRHYSTGKTKKDAVNKKNDSTWNQGKARFKERLKTNFGVENPIMKYEDIVW